MMSADVPTVFVVDDDALVRKAIQGMLKSVGLRSETFGTPELSARLQAIGGTKTSTWQDSQLCRLLTPLPSFSEHRDARHPFLIRSPDDLNRGRNIRNLSMEQLFPREVCSGPKCCQT
jgi:hypothetical protein